MRLAILGFGLIGGSVARALRVAGAAARPEIVAWSPGGEGPRRAEAQGVVDEAAADPAGAIEGADLVLLAAPPIACLELLDRLAGPLRVPLGDALVTDVASTKGAIVERAAMLRLRFVGGHPMAGREASGYGASDAELFAGRPWVVVGDGARPEEIAIVEGIAAACRARPLRLAADAHDSAVAAISHLPLVVAAALVQAVAGSPDQQRPDWAVAAELAASGWRDVTRLARGEVDMGAGILATNAGAVASRIRDLRGALDAWLATLEAPDGPDAERLAAGLRGAREVLEGSGRPGG